MREFVIKDNEANQRFDKYLKKLLPNAGSGFLYRMLRKKNITLNKSKAEGKELLQKGDVVQIFFAEETFLKFSSGEGLPKLPKANPEILYEDADVIMINKPAGMLSQKAESSDFSANEVILSYLIAKGEVTEESYKTFHPSVCNRLDRNTSGILIGGKSLKGLQEMGEALRDRKMEKYYHCLVKGTGLQDGRVTFYLKKHEGNNTVEISETPLEDGEQVVTGIQVLQEFSDVSFLKIHLITGKTHQIRSVLSYLGHPILGDPKYGDAKVNAYYKGTYGLKHQLLHAREVVFPDGKKVEAPYPVVFEKILKELK